MSLRGRISSAWRVLTGQPSARGYKAAQQHRLTMDWISSTLDTNDEIRKDQTKLRGHARELAKNNPHVRQYLNLLDANVVGDCGIKLQSRVKNNDGTPAKPINDRLERGWYDWARKPGVGAGSLREHVALALRTCAVDGEILIHLIDSSVNKYGLRIALIDADRLDQTMNDSGGNGKPQISMGVELDADGAPAAYHCFSHHPNANYAAQQRTRVRIPARDIIHLYRPDRPGAHRGMSWLAQSAYPLNMLEGYVEAELVAARTGAAKMGWFEWKDNADVETFDPDKDTVNLESNPGSIGFVPPGTQFKEWSPDHPTAAFPAFVKSVLRQTASGLGVSYNALANDLEGVNYSSLRSGLLIERDNWRTLQRWLIEALYEPLYDRWLSNALMMGAMVLDSRDPARFREVLWQPRGWQWVDPLKDAQAAVLEIGNALNTRTAVLAERGLDFETTLDQLGEEQELIDVAGIEIAGLPTAAPAGAGAAGSNPSESSVETEKEDGEDAARSRLTLIAGTR